MIDDGTLIFRAGFSKVRLLLRKRFHHNVIVHILSEGVYTKFSHIVETYSHHPNIPGNAAKLQEKKRRKEATARRTIAHLLIGALKTSPDHTNIHFTNY